MCGIINTQYFVQYNNNAFNPRQVKIGQTLNTQTGSFIMCMEIAFTIS